MNDTLMVAIIAGSFAVGGGLLTQFGSYVNQKQQREREREADARSLRRARYEHMSAVCKTLVMGAWAMHTVIDDTRSQRLRGLSWEQVGPFGMAKIYNSSFTKEAFQTAQVEASLDQNLAQVLDSFAVVRMHFFQFVDEFEQQGDMSIERMKFYSDGLYQEIVQLIALIRERLDQYSFLPSKKEITRR